MSNLECDRFGRFGRRGLPAVVALAVVLVATPSVWAADTAARPASAADLMAQGEVPLTSVPRLDRQALALEDLEREAAGLAPRYAVSHDVFITPDSHGVWEPLDASTSVWRLRIGSPDALSLNLGFTRFRMPEGGRLLLYTADRSQVVRPFTVADNAAHGELWSPAVPGDEIVVEVVVPEDRRAELLLRLTSINVGYRFFGEQNAERSGSCNVDVVCPEGDAWRDEIPSVAVISTGGSLFCTGFMVNNTAADAKPLFMTANHCGIGPSNAASLVAYWNYETSSCGGPRDGSLSDFQSGAFFRASYSSSDFTLVELDSDPDPTWGVTFAGWDRSGADASSAIAIHQPSTDEKAISFEFAATTTTNYLGTSVPGNGTHVRVIDWDVGTTEPGSSGSPLFNQDHRVIGQLHGGYAACSNNSSDWYGKFSVSWTGGGTSTSRLSDWLDPLGTGALSVDTLAAGGCESHAECDDGQFCNGAELCSIGKCVPGSDPCPGEDCDEANDVCVPPVCNSDGTCDAGEDCGNCSADCISGSGATCGNAICEIGAGEDCLSCPSDCNGQTTGKPSSRYCCGTDVGCGDSRCESGGNTCGGAGEPYCCGDAVCEGPEDSFSCAVDCGAPQCPNGVCDSGSGESACSCPMDCGAPPSNETSCGNGTDDDCDGDVDCADGDCAGDPSCPSCTPLGQSCSTDADCCSSKCRGPAGRSTCK